MTYFIVGAACFLLGMAAGFLRGYRARRGVKAEMCALCQKQRDAEMDARLRGAIGMLRHDVFEALKRGDLENARDDAVDDAPAAAPVDLTRPPTLAKRIAQENKA